MVTFRRNLIGHGWAECEISDGATGATATASYLSDGIGDFVAALQSLFRSAKTASCEFAEEPGAFLWELVRCDSDVLIRLQWLPEEGTPENRFSVRCDLNTFAKQVDAEFDRNLTKWGRDGFEREWGYRFPTEAHSRLKAGIAGVED